MVGYLPSKLHSQGEFVNKTLKYWFLDAFTSVPFKGNPTVVIVTSERVETKLMQRLAAEFNLSETVFVSGIDNDKADLKWFTPSHEVKLCGHGTLSAAHILFEQQLVSGKQLRFQTLSGELKAIRNDAGIQLTFPRIATQINTVPSGLSDAVGTPVIGFAQTQSDDGYWVAEVESNDLSELNVDLSAFSALSGGSLIVTSAVDRHKVALRYFAPNHGVDEDPVTGSANVVLADYWMQTKGWEHFNSLQQSARTGSMQVQCLERQVEIVGCAVTLAQGVINL